MIVWVMCVILLIGTCNLGFVRKTWSAFGNVSGQLTIPCNVNYYSNYPDDVLLSEDVKTEYVSGQSYIIKENTFVVSGYEFVSWNSVADGTGKVYNSGDSIPLEISLNFYAQWKKVEVPVASYGDVNVDGLINEDDYLLIEQFINTSNELTGQSLLNADVNVDGKVDLVDADIIKQVCLGIDGYVGVLPSNPILVYEIYNDEKEEEENENANNTENNNGENSSSGGSGSGSSSGGSSNGGSSGDGNSFSGTSSKPSSNKENKPSLGGNSSINNSEQGNATIDEENDILDKNELLEENKSNTILGEDDTNKENNHLNKNEFDKNENKKGNNLYPIIIVFGICLLAIRLILYVIKRFNEKNDSDKGDF